MVILIDANVILDVLMKREPFFGESRACLEYCMNRKVSGYVALHTISNIWYTLRKIPAQQRRQWLMDICQMLQVAGVAHEEVCKAIQMSDFSDFEDCLQDRCAKGVEAQYIVTRNIADFTHSEIPAISPTDFLKLINRAKK